MGGDFPSSLKLMSKAWMVNFFAPFTLYLVCPFGAAFRFDLLRRDICTVSLVSLMHLGPEFRSGFASGCRSEPKLAAIAYMPPPKAHTKANMEGLKNWPGYTWCEANKWDWEDRIFSTRWKQLSQLSVGIPG